MSLFVVFEGIDGSGKSSQVGRLIQRLEAKGRSVVRLVEPTDGPHGREIRQRAKHGPPLAPREELDLFVKDRRENVNQNIAPALEAGRDVVQDRYFYSTAAYQAARPELEVTPGDVVSEHAWAPRPDLVVLLDLPVSAGLARVRGRGVGDAFEHEALQEKVRSNFLALAGGDDRFCVIDAGMDEIRVAAAVWAAVEPMVEAEA